jgi:hypothetical protein
LTLPALAAFALGGWTSFAPASEVGSPAPDIEPSEWLNTKTPLSWSQLAGRVILIEKWATW